MKKILIVEDEQDLRDLLDNYLTNEGYEVSKAGDGVEALSLFSKYTYDLVVLDIMIPKIDGFGVCEVIKKQSNVPVVFLSALNDEGSQIKGYDKSADDYVTKPFSMPVFLRKVNALMRRNDTANSSDSTPLCICGDIVINRGINELSDVDRLLNAGADKVSINSAAIRRPELINEIASHFGSQVCVVAIDAKQTLQGWRCFLNGGRLETERDLFQWAKEANDRGAGEILFTSMDHDGVKEGFANEALATLASTLSIPVIASGGAGRMEHFRDAFIKGHADAALAASVFHFGEIGIKELKDYLRKEGICVR